jgi:hypothetical protein
MPMTLSLILSFRVPVPFSLYDEHNIGASKNVWECKLINLFTNRSEAEKWIVYILNHADPEKGIKLIGISLRDYFHAGKGFYVTIQKVSNGCKRKNQKLRPNYIMPPPIVL